MGSVWCGAFRSGSLATPSSNVALLGGSLDAATGKYLSQSRFEAGGEPFHRGCLLILETQLAAPRRINLDLPTASGNTTLFDVKTLSFDAARQWSADYYGLTWGELRPEFDFWSYTE